MIASITVTPPPPKPPQFFLSKKTTPWLVYLSVQDNVDVRVAFEWGTKVKAAPNTVPSCCP